ncbi:MAG: DnaD domain protein [Lachnospiraceae bacterium]|nr:DnaD domain protein [Lachnospiraceae bacterium]
MPDEIILHSSCTSQVTCVSNDFIDNFMPESSGEFVKTYLYLLRSLSANQMNFSIKRAADTLHHTEADIRRALQYWEEKGLLRLEYDSNGTVVGICILNKSDSNLTTLSKKEETKVEIPVEPEPAEEVEENIVPRVPFDEATLEEVYNMAEMLNQKPLSSRDMQFILSWNTDLGLSPDLIEYLIEVCMNNGHSSFYYMNTIAIKWKEQGIQTEEAARAADDIHSKAYYTVVKAFGIKERNLNSREEKYLSQWTTNYHFSNDLLQEACERALNNTGKISFAYADKILKDWHNNQIKTIGDVRRKDSSRPASKPKAVSTKTTKFQNFTERDTSDTSIIELERKLLQ